MYLTVMDPHSKPLTTLFIGGYNDILTGQKERQHELHKKHWMTGRINAKNHPLKAYSIKEYDIPSSLYVNSDQMQVVFAPGDKMTYAEKGAKQVSLVGGDEKRAFTMMVSIANNEVFTLPHLLHTRGLLGLYSDCSDFTQTLLRLILAE